MEKTNKKNKAHYTQCNLYTKKGKYGNCSIHRINYNWLEEDLIKLIKEVCVSFLNEYDNKKLTEEANEIYREESNKLQKAIDTLQYEINKINKAIEQLYMDKVEGKLIETIFNNLLKKYSDNLNDYTNKKDELEKEKAILLSKLNLLDYDKCASLIKKYITNKKITRAFVCELIEKVEIDDSHNIKVYFNYPELTSYAR